MRVQQPSNRACCAIAYVPLVLYATLETREIGLFYEDLVGKVVSATYTILVCIKLQVFFFKHSGSIFFKLEVISHSVSVTFDEITIKLAIQ